MGDFEGVWGGAGEDNALCRDNAVPYSCHLPLVRETKREEWGPHRLGAVRTRVSAIGKGSWGGDGSGVQCWVGGLSLGRCKCHKNQGAAARPSRHITAAVK